MGRTRFYVLFSLALGLSASAQASPDQGSIEIYKVQLKHLEGSEAEIDIRMRLGALCEDQARATTGADQARWLGEARSAYLGIVTHHPLHAQVPEAMVRYMGVAALAGQQPKAEILLRQLIEAYARATDPKIRGIEGIEPAFRALVARLEAEVATPSAPYLQGWLPELLGMTYAGYLEQFGSLDLAYDVLYKQARLLDRAGRSEEAREHYKRVVRLDPNGIHSRDAALQIVASARDALQRPEPSGAPLSRTGELTQAEEQFIGACDWYLIRYADESEHTRLSYEVGHLLYNRGLLGEAAERLQEVIERSPTSIEAEFSATLILHGLADQQDWNTLYQVASEFYADPQLGQQWFKANALAMQHEATLGKIGRHLADTGNHLEAAGAYATFGLSLEDEALSERALRLAVRTYERGGFMAEAAQVRTLLGDPLPQP
ncbi:MAG TPA: tetratricopeptide repeat protein, partial [Deltaproteobacteria bacterium]|nr:tetratricopeptide repeat protein [Deltaproteobacteria bacterium]